MANPALVNLMSMTLPTPDWKLLSALATSLPVSAAGPSSNRDSCIQKGKHDAVGGIVVRKERGRELGKRVDRRCFAAAYRIAGGQRARSRRGRRQVGEDRTESHLRRRDEIQCDARVGAVRQAHHDVVAATRRMGTIEAESRSRVFTNARRVDGSSPSARFVGVSTMVAPPELTVRAESATAGAMPNTIAATNATTPTRRLIAPACPDPMSLLISLMLKRQWPDSHIGLSREAKGPAPIIPNSASASCCIVAD